jgi:hypothetical protein
MAKTLFKRFSDLEFIQSIDIRTLVQVLIHHSDYFTRQKLDLNALGNDDASARQLLKVFTSADEETPQDLLDVLYMIDDLADDEGHDRVMSSLIDANLDMTWATGQMGAGDFIIAAYSRYPDEIRNCHIIVARKVKNFHEFRAKDDTRLTLAKAKERSNTLARALSPWFESKGRSSVCSVFPYEDGNEIRFRVTHGQLYRTNGTINKRNQMSRLAFRPQQHDAVAFDVRTFTLKINARTFGEQDLYRTVFGQVLFNDLDHFPGLSIYTLNPLRSASLGLNPVPGLMPGGVKLTEVWIQFDTPVSLLVKYHSSDLKVSIDMTGVPNLQAGAIIRAAFMLRYESGGRPRKLEIRPPNIAIYDRDRDGEVTERFLQINDYILPETDSNGVNDDDEFHEEGVDIH